MQDFDLKSAKDIERKTYDYHWHGRIREGEICVVAGRPRGGKSTVVIDIVADYTRSKHHVILSAQEDSETRVQDRLIAAGADMDYVSISADGDHYNLPDDMGLLGLHITKNNVKLVVLDTAAQHLKPSITNDQAVRAALSPIHKLAEATGCTFLFVDHVTKHVSKTADPITAFRGNGLPGAARMAMFVGVNPENSAERVVAWVKDQYRELPKAMAFEAESFDVLDDDDKLIGQTMRLILTDDAVDIDPLAVLGGKASEESGAPRADKVAVASEWLTIYLSTGKKPVKQLRDDAAQSGLAWATIRRAADALEVEKSREGFGKGSAVSWALPLGHPALAEAEEGLEADGEVPADFIGPLLEGQTRLSGVEVLSDEDATLTDQDIANLLNGA